MSAQKVSVHDCCDFFQTLLIPGAKTGSCPVCFAPCVPCLTLLSLKRIFWQLQDPNAQLSSALSKRNSQLLQPSQSQTEAAIAAILGSGKDTSDPDFAADPAAEQTAVMSPSLSLGRFVFNSSARTIALLLRIRRMLRGVKFRGTS